MFQIQHVAINKLFKWLFSRVLASRRPGFDSRSGHASLWTSILGCMEMTLVKSLHRTNFLPNLSRWAIPLSQKVYFSTSHLSARSHGTKGLPLSDKTNKHKKLIFLHFSPAMLLENLPSSADVFGCLPFRGIKSIEHDFLRIKVVFSSLHFLREYIRRNPHFLLSSSVAPSPSLPSTGTGKFFQRHKGKKE